MKTIKRFLPIMMMVTAILFASGCAPDDPNNGGTTYQGHEYVDLGLPSGNLWATCNLGAETPEDYGDFFAWGETQPKEAYHWTNYAYSNGDYDQLTKYCDNPDYGYNGFTDSLNVLEAGDDAVVASWGADWRMPTETEWQELWDNTTSTWTTQNGVNGRIFTAQNGNSLFLPAAGYFDGDEASNGGVIGSYWASSTASGYPHYAEAVYFLNDLDLSGLYPNVRCCGRSVRAVYPKN